MQKEIITMDNIKHDLKYSIKNLYITLAFCLLFIPIYFYIIYKVLSEPSLTFEFVLAVVCSVVIIVFFITALVSTIKSIIISTKSIDNFDIISDKLNKPEEEIQYSARRGLRTVYHYYHLHFKSFGKYTIPRKNYTWSSEYSMRNKGVYETSSDGDEFYLVVSKNKSQKVLLVYNKKLFELE